MTLLGDVGGFYGIISAFFALLNNAFSYQRAENLFVQTLYQAKSQNKGADNGLDLTSKGQLAFKEYLQDFLEGCCGLPSCLKRSRRDLQFVKARDLLQEELDLVEVLRKLRFF